jgi:predicted MPP superfamily phosphohydrolase
VIDMGVNKVTFNTENGVETLIDLSNDTVTPETLAEGETAHDASGNIITGTMTGGNGDIPTYHYIESARVVDNILAFKSAHPNSLIFAVVCDIHVYIGNETYESKSITAIKNAAFALETVGAMVDCDFIANLGDNCWENGIDTDNALLGAKASINSLKPAFNRLDSFDLVGNHDKSDDTQKQYDLIGSHNDFDVSSATKIRGFGYKDYTAKKVRVICLNTCDYLNASGGCALSYEQKDFLMRALDLSSKTDCAEWQILLLSHIPLDWNGGDYNFYADLQTILNAYEDGTTASITVNSSYALRETPSNYTTYSSGKLVYNYSGKNSAKIIANIHGHVHTNKVSKIANTGIARVATANTNPDLNKSESYPEYGDYSITTTEANKIKKVSGTAKDTSATFYCIDLDEQIIYAFGYGADIDRTIPYKEATVHPVTYTLTDVTSSNTASGVVEGASFTTTLSVGKDRVLDTVIVTMGGVDVTSSVHSNGTINIPSVTGAINIKATSKDNYVPHWDIADRTAVTNMYKGPNETKELSRHNYYWGAASTGAVYNNRCTNCTVNGNDLTFTMVEKNMGIGVPYHLEAGASYTFSATSSVKGRIRYRPLNADGTINDNTGAYGSSGTSHSLIFTAPTDATQWVMLIFDAYTANESVTYSNVTLTKN